MGHIKNNKQSMHARNTEIMALQIEGIREKLYKNGMVHAEKCATEGPQIVK